MLKNTYRKTWRFRGKQHEHTFTNNSYACTADNMIHHLIQAQKTNVADNDASDWARSLIGRDDALYDKLTRWGLVPKVEVKEVKKVKDLIEVFLNTPSVSKGTISTYKEFADDLRDFVGLDFPLEEFTVELAAKYVKWRETTPCRCNGKKASTDPALVARRRKPLTPRKPKFPSPNTVKKRIELARQYFGMAVQLDWLTKNPFQYQHGGKSVNPERLLYLDSETVNHVIDETPNVEHKAYIALRRYAGIRGNSEYRWLNWNLECFRPSHTDPKTGKIIPGSLTIRQGKTERYGGNHVFRTVPLAPKLEEVLLLLFEQAKEGEKLMFPDPKANPGKAITDAFKKNGIDVLNPYNVRRSYCCDLMEAGIEPMAYEALAGHNWKTGMKFYQIMHPERKRKSDEKFLSIWQTEKAEKPADSLESSPQLENYSHTTAPSDSE